MPLTPEQVEQIAIAAANEVAENSAREAANLAANKVAMSKSELDQVVAEAVKQTLAQLGVDTTDPFAMQRDFQHLRQWRESGENLKEKGTTVLIGIFISGLCTLLILGLKEWWGK